MTSESTSGQQSRTANTRRPAPTETHLLQLAARPAYPTKKAAREALLSIGVQAGQRFVDALLQLQARFRVQRETRRARQLIARLGHLPEGVYSNGAPVSLARPPVRLPYGTPLERLEKLRKAAVSASAKSVLRHGASGGSSMQVGFASCASEVSYSVTMGSNWDTYRGSFKGWRANEDHHRVVVPADWRLRVERRGLAVLGGMLTLDAHELLRDSAARVYAATWARQGRGYQVHVDRGYLAVQAGEHFHADSPEGAVKGLLRKLSGRQRATPGMALTVEEFVRRYGRYREVSVSLDDARDSGSCEYGIRSWCERVGISYSDGEVSLGRVLEGFCLAPQEEVRRAVLHAIRRHRREARIPTETERSGVSADTFPAPDASMVSARMV